MNILFEQSEQINQKDWKRFISECDDPQDMILIKQETLKGRPIAGSTFITKLEESLNRILRPKPKGRPKKEEESVFVPF